MHEVIWYIRIRMNILLTIIVNHLKYLWNYILARIQEEKLCLTHFEKHENIFIKNLCTELDSFIIEDWVALQVHNSNNRVPWNNKAERESVSWSV